MSKTSQNHTSSQQETMLRSTLWSSFGNFASRLLGLIYVIPWYRWLNVNGQGAEANALFTMGYNIYGLILLVSTAGIPVAVSKQVAKYRAKHQLNVVYQMLQQAMKLMTMIGLVLAVAMYICAPLIASFSGGDKQLVPVIHSLAWAVLIFPVMSVIRGFFQGFNDMQPYAASQIFEQIIRVIWMLSATYMIMKAGSADYAAAVTQSTFAAFIGMLSSCAVLVYYLWRKEQLLPLFKPVKADEKIDTTALLMETLREAIPFIITGSAIQIFQLIDQGTFINLMKIFTNYKPEALAIQFAYFSGNPNKIIMILVAIATSIGGVGIPLLTENYINRDKKASAHLIVNNLVMLMTILVPAVVGGMLLSRPLYAVFYEMPNHLANGLFLVCLIQTIILALYTVLSPMIQALFENRRAIIYFVYGLIAKLILQVPTIYLFHAYGPLISTSVGLLIPIVLIYLRIHAVTGLNQTYLYRRMLLIGLLSTIMAVTVAFSIWLLSLVLPHTTTLTSLIYLIIGGGVGVAVYGGLALITRLLDGIIGRRAETLRQKLHIK